MSQTPFCQQFLLGVLLGFQGAFHQLDDWLCKRQRLARQDAQQLDGAVSEGAIVIRDGDNLTQAVSGLSRDVEHANQTLSPIFDKEREQNRLQEAQLIGEIGNQAADIARTEGQIRATNAGKAELAKNGITERGEGASQDEWARYNEKLTATDSYKAAQQQWGTGSAIQQGIQAATAAVQGLAGGNLAQAASGAAAPYLAEVIHDMTTTKDANGKEVVNVEANLMAHAVVGAVTAYAAGNSALAGASGAAMGEYIAQQMYPGVDRKDLTEEQRQTISALGTLAAGLAGGVAGDGTAGAVAGAQAGRNAVENNWLSVEEADRKAVLERREKAGTITPEERRDLSDINQTDKARDQAIHDICTQGNKGSAACGALIDPAQEALRKYGEKVTYSLIYKDLYPQDAANLEGVLQGVDAGSISRDQAITAIAASTHRDWNEVAKDYDSAMQTQAIAAALAGMKGISSIASQEKNISREFKPSASSSAKTSSETYFRVEGGGSGTQTSQNRINVNSDGSVTINSGCSGQLCVSTNGPNHAAYYLTNRRQDGSVVVFEVDAKLHKQIMDTAVPQRPVPGVPKDPNAPKIVDPTKGQPSVSLELPKVWDKLIEKNSSNARVLTKEEFLHEFGK